MVRPWSIPPTTANNRLNLRPIGALEARAIPGTDSIGLGPVGPVFSPDGQSIAFFNPGDGTLKRIAVNGGKATTIGPVGTTIPSGMSWSADGIVIAQRGGIVRFSRTGGTPEQIVKVEADEAASRPHMLPGGDAILFTLTKGNEDRRGDLKRLVPPTKP